MRIDSCEEALALNSVANLQSRAVRAAIVGGTLSTITVMLNALGFYRKGDSVSARGPEANLFTAETVTAVDAFRISEKMGTPAVGGSPAGLVDDETVARLWAALERAGKTKAVRQALLDVTMVRR